MADQGGFDLSPDEMALLVAAVEATEQGGDVHDAAIAAVAHLEQGVRMAMVERLHDARFVDAAILRGGGNLQSVHIRKVLGPGVQVVRAGRTATVVLSVVERRVVETLLTALERAESSGEFDRLPAELRAELEADKATIEAQLRSPKPKRSVIREALKSLRDSAVVGFGGALGAGAGAGVLVAIREAAQHLLR